MALPGCSRRNGILELTGGQMWNILFGVYIFTGEWPVAKQLLSSAEARDSFGHMMDSP